MILDSGDFNILYLSQKDDETVELKHRQEGEYENLVDIKFQPKLETDRYGYEKLVATTQEPRYPQRKDEIEPYYWLAKSGIVGEGLQYEGPKATEKWPRNEW